jgi:diguanylate cyclase (GGDEF)-like protein
MENDAIISVLKNTDFFGSLPQDCLSEIAASCGTEFLEKGAILFGDDDEGDCLYIVTKGEISVTRPGEEGARVEIARFVNGNLFGEIDLVMKSKRGAEATAETESALLRFPARGKTVENFRAAHPASAARLLLRFLQVAAGRIRASNTLLKENSPWVQEMRNQVYRDKLTGIYNKTYLTEQLSSFLKKEPVSLLMIKPDNFKEINDTYGHEAGDQALVATALALSRFVPVNAVVCRFSGNELGLILPGSDSENAARFAEKIRNLYNTLDLGAVTGGKPFSLSVSVGIACYPKHATESNALIEAAHELPLLGRARGGNKVLFPEDK